MSKLIEVRAIALGYYGGELRHPGQDFFVPAGTKGSWFAPLAGAAKPARGQTKTDAPAADESDPDAEDLV